MHKINIARIILQKRKEKGITQEDLAQFIGVSKASVSKWETAQSYPDITFLPQLASYFNISVDELIGYEPQLTQGDIRKLYHQLSSDFAQKPFDEVLGQCRQIIKKYHACFPLLFYMGVLLLNHCMLAGDEPARNTLVDEANTLFAKVQRECSDMELGKHALNMQAFCSLLLGRPEEVLQLIGEATMPLVTSETLLASAYEMTGNTAKAKTVVQVSMYQHMLTLFGALTAYLKLTTEDAVQFKQTHKRAHALAAAFNLSALHPASMMNFHLVAAQGFSALLEKEKALDALQQYQQLVTADIYPITLHGDAYFHLLDSWLEDLALGIQPPRNEKNIRQSMVDAVEQNPAFASLLEEPRFKQILAILENSR